MNIQKGTLPSTGNKESLLILNTEVQYHNNIEFELVYLLAGTLQIPDCHPFSLWRYLNQYSFDLIPALLFCP